MLKDVSLLTSALTDVETAMDYLRVFTHDDVPFVTRAINHATGLIESKTARQLKSRAQVFRLDGNGCPTIYVPEFPVTAVSAAEYTGDSTSFAALNMVGIVVDDGGMIFLPNDVFPLGNQNVRITCTAGFAAGQHDAQLADLEHACLRMVQVNHQDWKFAVGKATSIGVGGTNATFSSAAWPEDVLQTLMRYSRVL